MPDMRGLVISTTRLASSCQKTVRNIQANSNQFAVSSPGLPTLKVSATMYIAPQGQPSQVLPRLRDLGVKIGKNRKIALPKAFLPKTK
jgi:hypothetical protein